VPEARLSPASGAAEGRALERLTGSPRLRILGGEAAHLVCLTVPEVGDRLKIWPLLSPGSGSRDPQRLLDLELLETAEGLAWRPLAGELHANRVDGAAGARWPSFVC
jgi:hypothetical protein